MDTTNAFIGLPNQPTPNELSAALGAAASLWKELITWMATEMRLADWEWRSASPKYGWSPVLQLKNRRILYLSPCPGCFRASFVLGARAVSAAHTGDLPKSLIKAIDEAPRYAEGTGVRILVSKQRDLAGIRKLVAIKLAN